MPEIILRPLRIADYDTWYQGFAKRLPSQNDFDKGYLDLSECDRAWFEGLVNRHQQLLKEDKQYIYAIFDKATQQHIGAVDVVVLDKDQLSWAEIGYFVHNQFWRQGYGLAALNELLRLNQTDLGFHRLEAHVLQDNLPSQSLLLKAGFTYEGVRKAFLREENGWKDAAVYVWIDGE